MGIELVQYMTKSTSGYCTMVWGNLANWRSKKQTVVALSSAKAELRVLAKGTCELICLKRLLEELKLQNKGPMKLFCDNKAALSIAHHDRTKHVEVTSIFSKRRLDV